MSPGMRGKRDKFDPDARKVPAKAQVFLLGGLVASVAVAVYTHVRIDGGIYEQTDLGVVLLTAPTLLAGFISWLMMWRDEIEIHDGSIMGGVAVLGTIGQLIMSLSVETEWAGAAVLAAAHGVLAARNSKGLRVAWLKQAIPHGRATEWAVAIACGGGIMGVLTLSHIKHGYGLATMCTMAFLYATTCISMLVATLTTCGERIPKVNANEMWRAVMVLCVAECARGAALALSHSTQVVATSAASMLFGIGLALAGIAAYRRTILRSKNNLV